MKGYGWVIVYRIPTTKCQRMVHNNWFRLLRIEGASGYIFYTQAEARAVLKRLRTELASFNSIFDKRASVQKMYFGGIIQ